MRHIKWSVSFWKRAQFHKIAGMHMCALVLLIAFARADVGGKFLICYRVRISFEHYFFWQHFKPPNRSVSQENSFGFSGNLAEILIENRFHESTSFLGILNSLFHLCVNCFRRVCRSSARNARFQSKLKAQMNPMCQHHDVLQFMWTQICIREIQKV